MISISDKWVQNFKKWVQNEPGMSKVLFKLPVSAKVHF